MKRENLTFHVIVDHAEKTPIPPLDSGPASVAERPVVLPTCERERAPCPSLPYLDDHQFDPETKRVMGLAFEMACVALRLAHRDDQIKQMVTNNLIERWKTGERNPDVLCEQAVKDLRRHNIIQKGLAFGREQSGSVTVPGTRNSSGSCPPAWKETIFSRKRWLVASRRETVRSVRFASTAKWPP